MWVRWFASSDEVGGYANGNVTTRRISLAIYASSEEAAKICPTMSFLVYTYVPIHPYVSFLSFLKPFIMKIMWLEPQSTQWSQWVGSVNTKKLPDSEQCLQGQQGPYSEEKSKDKSLVSCSNLCYCKFCGNFYRKVSSYKLQVLWWSSNHPYKKILWQETLPMASDVVSSVQCHMWMVLVAIVWEAHWNVGEAEQIQWPKLAKAYDNDKT